MMLERIQPKLTGAMIESLQTPIKLEEFTIAVGEMAKLKTPSPDGILTEFYQSLWPVLRRYYWKMVQEAINGGCFLQGVTYKGITCNTLNAWWPITLLNTSYKIFTKTLQL